MLFKEALIDSSHILMLPMPVFTCTNTGLIIQAKIAEVIIFNVGEVPPSNLLFMYNVIS